MKCTWFTCEDEAVNYEYGFWLCEHHYKELDRAVFSMDPDRLRTALVRANGCNPLFYTLNDLLP